MKRILGILLVSTVLFAQECEIYTIEITDIKMIEGKEKIEYKVFYNNDMTPECIDNIAEHYGLEKREIEKI